MRLSPRSIFFAIVVFGLPVAVPVGWNAGTAPAPRPPSVPERAGAAGGIGDAPPRNASPGPSADQRTPRPYGVRVDTTAQPRRRGATASPRPSATATRLPVPTATVTSAPVATTPPVDSSAAPTEPPISNPTATPGLLQDRS